MPTWLQIAVVVVTVCVVTVIVAAVECIAVSAVEDFQEDEHEGVG